MVKNMPSDVYHEVGATDIDEGRFVAELDNAIAEAHAVLERRRVNGSGNCSVKVQAEICLRIDPKIPDYVSIEHVVTFRAPKETKSSLAISRGGKLLCQPDGTGLEPEQMRLFDKKGNPIGTLDTATGAVELDPPPSEVAGRVGAAV